MYISLRKIHQAWDYIRLLMGTWGFWLFVIPDIIFVIAQFVKPSLKLSNTFYVTVFLAGFLWSNFQVYRHMLRRIPGQGGVISLAISLLEGNEYKYRLKHPIETEAVIKGLIESPNVAYSFKQPFELLKVIIELEKNIDKEMFSLIDSEVELHLRVENNGDIPLSLLGIKPIFDDNKECPFIFLPALIFYSEGERMEFPVILEPNNNLVVSLRKTIKPKSLTSAILAANLASYCKGKSRLIKTEIIVQTKSIHGIQMNHRISQKVSLRPLADLYIANWQDSNRHDLVTISNNTIE